jgi:hypothetical protein
MPNSSQPVLTQPDIIKLKQLRESVLDFQKQIAALPAKDRDNARNKQFNQLWLETKALLKEQAFERNVSRAITEDNQVERTRKKLVPRLFTIITFGVILALVGLGINAIILDTLIVNIVGCLISTTGILMVIGAFAVFQVNQFRQRITNYGELYLRCDALLGQINMALGSVTHVAAESPNVPSVLALVLDSLHRQADDWQQKLNTLDNQRVTLGDATPPALKTNINFIQQEISRIRQEISALNGQSRPALPAGQPVTASPLLSAQVEEATPPAPLESALPRPGKNARIPTPQRPYPVANTFNKQPEVVEDSPPSPQVIENASAHTLGMPPVVVEAEEPEAAPPNEVDQDKQQNL